VQFHAMQLPVGIIQHDATVDLENFTGSREFFAPNDCQLVIIPGIATVGGCLAGGQADHSDFSAAIVVKAQASAKRGRFVIRMCRDTQNAHGGILRYQLRARAKTGKLETPRGQPQAMTQLNGKVDSSLKTAAPHSPKLAAPQSPATSSRIASSAACSSSMKVNTSCGTGAFHTGANDWRCRGDGPCLRKAARWCGVL